MKLNDYELNIEIFRGSIHFEQAKRIFDPDQGRIQIEGRYFSWIAEAASEEMSKQFELIFSFRDIRGIRWQRNAKGILEKSTIVEGS